MSKVTFPATQKFNKAQAAFVRHGGDLRVANPAHKVFTAAFGWITDDELGTAKAARKLVKINIVMAVAESLATHNGLTFEGVTFYDTETQTFKLAVTDELGNPRRGNLTLKRVSDVFRAIEPTAEEVADAALEATAIDL